MNGKKTVFARNCCVRKIDKALADSFLSENHLFGTAASRYRYGLFIARNGKHSSQFPIGTLVAVALFSAPRNWTKDGHRVRSYEWVRYASLNDWRICGGMGKMLQHFIEEKHPDDIMTYAPAPFDGAVYLKLGFVEEGVKDFGNGNYSRKFRLTLFPPLGEVAPPGIEPGSTV